MATSSVSWLGSMKNTTFPPVFATSALISVRPFWLLASVVRMSTGRPTVLPYASAPDFVVVLIWVGKGADRNSEGCGS